jgi:hypothetical protein
VGAGNKDWKSVYVVVLLVVVVLLGVPAEHQQQLSRSLLCE